MTDDALSAVDAGNKISPQSRLPIDVPDFRTLSLRPVDTSDDDAVLGHFEAFDPSDHFSRYFSSQSVAGLKSL